MSDSIRISLEDDDGQKAEWEYLVHDKVHPITLKQIFYKALSDKYGLDVIIRMTNGKETS